MLSDSESSTTTPKPKKNNVFYGVLSRRNIGQVVFGNYQFDTWYGNAAYFNPQGPHSLLGYEYSNRVASIPGKKEKKKVVEELTISNGVKPHNDDAIWLDKLYVCQYCFKYTDKVQNIGQHQAICPLNTKYAKIGKLMYRDDDSRYFIKQVRGFREQLFCQNLSLFGKLFLDDKSVYYNVDAFDFYVVYGIDKSLEPLAEEKFVPMGFFSKEVLSWDNDNNLACICIFPPFQRRHLGSLLIEFLYALAKVTPGQFQSGPEFPLSPFGKLSYLRFWSKILACIIYQNYRENSDFDLDSLSNITGFRKEDILFTLEYMKILAYSANNTGEVSLLIGNLKEWCTTNNVDPLQEKNMLNPNYLLI